MAPADIPAPAGAPRANAPAPAGASRANAPTPVGGMAPADAAAPAGASRANAPAPIGAPAPANTPRPAAPRVRLVLWDWNGTLLDDLAYAIGVRNRTFPAFGLPRIESVAEYHRQFTFRCAATTSAPG